MCEGTKKFFSIFPEEYFASPRLSATMHLHTYNIEGSRLLAQTSRVWILLKIHWALGILNLLQYILWAHLLHYTASNLHSSTMWSFIWWIAQILETYSRSGVYLFVQKAEGIMLINFIEMHRNYIEMILTIVRLMEFNIIKY